MKNDFYQEERIYHIYIIYDPYERGAYIGKTYSRNPRARFRAHLRGECQLTADDFLFDAVDPDAISFQLLESIVCTGSDAYRHVVAWCLYFEDHGLLLLNAAGTVQATEYLHPQTQAIYDAVCAPFSLEQVLTRKVTPLRAEPDTEPYIPPLRNLSIRVPEDTMKAFKEFCSTRGLSQQKALRLLLLACEDSSCQALWDDIQCELSEKDTKIAELEATIEKQRARIQRMKDRTDIVVATCKQYTRTLLTHLPAPTYRKLKALSFKSAKRTLDFASYAYPGTSGYGYFTLESLVYGRGRAPALFVLGRDAAGNRVKLRWYDKNSYVGAAFKYSSHAYEHSYWLVGYTTAPDGATDLVAAIPLVSSNDAAQENITPAVSHSSRPSIDSIIQAAEEKSKQ